MTTGRLCAQLASTARISEPMDQLQIEGLLKDLNTRTTRIEETANARDDDSTTTSAESQRSKRTRQNGDSDSHRNGRRHRGTHQLPDIIHRTDAPAEIDEPIDLRGGQREHGLIPELGVELHVRERPLQVPDRLLDKPRQLATIRQLNLQARLIFREG